MISTGAAGRDDPRRQERTGHRPDSVESRGALSPTDTAATEPGQDRPPVLTKRCPTCGWCFESKVWRCPKCAAELELINGAKQAPEEQDEP